MNLSLLKENAFFKTQNLDYAFDSLTKVLNREMITLYIKYLIENDKPFSLCLCDIDNFKYVNDTYGHMIGDQVLYDISQQLIASLGPKGVIGRYGGDEFIIIAENISEYTDIWNFCHTLNRELSKMHFSNYQELSVTLTTGVARYPLDGTTYEDILQKADKALYRGKTKGRNCFIIYLKEKHENIVHNIDKENLYNSMDMHAKIFNILTSNDNLTSNINKLLKLLSTTLMIDHICIETKDKLVVSVLHSLSPIKDFQHMKIELIENAMNGIGLFYVNQRKTLLQIHFDELFHSLKSQSIRSVMACSIDAYGKNYGILRFDMCGKERIWQNSEMDLLVTSAKLIATLLYLMKEELDILN